MARPARVTRLDSRGWLAGGTYSNATLTTALTGTNNDLKFHAAKTGTAGNSVTITYVVAGNNTPLTVSASGNAVTVNVATSGAGAATSTAAQVRNAVMNAGGLTRTLIANVENATGNDGSGTVTALSATSLTGGADARTLGVGGGVWRRIRQRGRNS